MVDILRITGETVLTVVAICFQRWLWSTMVQLIVFKSKQKIHDTHFIVVHSMATYLQQKRTLVKCLNLINIFTFNFGNVLKRRIIIKCIMAVNSNYSSITWAPWRLKHRHRDCLLKCLFGASGWQHIKYQNSASVVLAGGSPPVTFPSQRANNVESVFMMTSSNGNIFRVTGHLCGEFTGPRWIPRTNASDAELWCFLWSASE